jgi:tRNA-splicing ligase RtcB
MDKIKQFIPLGEGHSHKKPQQWNGFERYLASLSDNTNTSWPADIDRRNLGTLGGGNHFIELQECIETFSGDYHKGKVWLMIHSGSRNLGYRIAAFYHKKALKINEEAGADIPVKDLAYFAADSVQGRKYIRDMNFALEYACENRRRMMAIFRECFVEAAGKATFTGEVNIHHNYAVEELHFGRKLWIHRKGATSAKNGETGIIPGSMGTASYIVRGLGNPDSFMSCSHGAGRKMGRNEASKRLSAEECDKAMEGIVFDRWNKLRAKWGKKRKSTGLYDLSEAPQAYKNIDTVIKSELDLIEPLVKLRPLAVLKG